MAITQARAKLVTLVGVEKADEIYQEAVSAATRGAEVDEQAVIDAIERAYDKAARRESLP
jgi:hypothetical protein